MTHIPPIETFPAKRLLTPQATSPEGFFEANYNTNLYRGCNHGCIYCDTRSDCYQIDRFDVVRCKENCLSLLEGELRQKKRAGVVSMGAASDPYNNREADLCLTRQALELLRKYSFGVGIPTKGDLIARDADVLADISKAAPVRISFSITTPDDRLASLLEPGAPPPSKRFQAMAALAQAGVFTGTWLNPVLPFLTDGEDTLQALLEETARHGGCYAVCHFGMTLRSGNREYFFAALEAEPAFAGMKQRYVDAFGLSYMCPSPQANRLARLFRETCRRLGLLYRFADINRAARDRCPQQLSLW